jgi:hypothetical protein
MVGSNNGSACLNDRLRRIGQSASTGLLGQGHPADQAEDKASGKRRKRPLISNPRQRGVVVRPLDRPGCPVLEPEGRRALWVKSIRGAPQPRHVITPLGAKSASPGLALCSYGSIRSQSALAVSATSARASSADRLAMSKSAIMASAPVAMPSAAARERACSGRMFVSLSRVRMKA